MKCVFFFKFLPVKFIQSLPVFTKRCRAAQGQKNKLTQILNKASNNNKGKNPVNLMKPL